MARAITPYQQARDNGTEPFTWRNDRTGGFIHGGFSTEASWFEWLDQDPGAPVDPVSCGCGHTHPTQSPPPPEPEQPPTSPLGVD